MKRYIVIFICCLILTACEKPKPKFPQLSAGDKVIIRIGETKGMVVKKNVDLSFYVRYRDNSGEFHLEIFERFELEKVKNDDEQ